MAEYSTSSTELLAKQIAGLERQAALADELEAALQSAAETSHVYTPGHSGTLIECKNHLCVARRAALARYEAAKSQKQEG